MLGSYSGGRWTLNASVTLPYPGLREVKPRGVHHAREFHVKSAFIFLFQMNSFLINLVLIIVYPTGEIHRENPERIGGRRAVKSRTFV